MKMKTQIKRKAKRTLSLLLTAMLIISTMVVSLSVVNAAGSDGYQTACMHLIGDFTGQNWNSNQKEYDIDTAYNTGVSDGLFYYEATVTPNTTYYFALYSNDNRYAPATQNTVIANSKESAMSGDYSHDGNSWKYTSGANTTKVRICVDQYSPSEKWYPLVWIEDESVEPTTSAPTGEYYLWTSVGKNDLTNTSLWTKYPLSATSDGMYNAPSVAIPTENNDLFLTVTKTSDNPYNTMVWENQGEAKTNSINNSSYVGGIDQQQYGVSQTNKNYFFLRIYFKSRNGSLSVNYDPSTKGLIFADAGTESTTEEPTTVEPTTVEPTTIEPTTVEPTTVEPTTVAPTTAPSATEWYIKGTFNSWGTTNQLRGSGNELTTNVYIDSSQVQEFKVWNKTGDKYYGTQTQTSVVNETIKNYVVYEAADLKCNVKFKPTESGIYKFTFNPSTFTLNAEFVQSGLNAEVSAPESVKAGETFSITAKAIPDPAITPASYKFTIMIGDTVVVNDAESKTEQYTYNRATISKESAIYTIVKAYDADGNIIAVSDKTECSHTVTVTYDELTVKLSADGSEVVAGTDVTLTAAATPASYVSSYDFLISKSYDFKGTDLVKKTSSSSTLKYRFNTTGTYYVKVVAHNKYGQTANTADATSNIIEISVVETSGEHNVTFYFKAPSAFAYFPKMTLDGTALKVTKDPELELGASFTGSVTFYWYKATATVDSSNTHTLSVSTRRTNASGSMTGNFYGSEYWLAIDNLMSGKTLANLTSLQPYIRNYYHSPLHTVYAGVADDGTLGFTNINGTRYAMGTYADGDPSTTNAALSIKAATAAQKSATQLEKYSEVQTCLLDVNLDGRVDVLDATMIQRALVNIQ